MLCLIVLINNVNTKVYRKHKLSPKPLKFYRRVGFGLRPDEASLSNPLKWAQNQMENTPDIIWSGYIYSET